MASTTTDLVLDIGSITGLSMSDINGSADVPRARPGTITFIVDAFGYKVMKYIKNLSGSAFVMGDLVSKPADVAVGTISAGSTTTSIVTTGLTADVHAGKMLYILDNADSAGAAPEGEVAIVTGNTAALIRLDAARPFGTSPAASDTGVLISTWQAKDAADGEDSFLVHGVVVASGGISDTHFGWVQTEGVCPRAAIDTNQQTIRDSLVAAAACLGPDGTDLTNLRCAICLVTVTSDQTALMAPVGLTLFSMISGIGAT
jgi:hypothetical protein